ncbi:Uncharacterised protein [Chlamydia trachomatis]|nr:Uncharacterised protein [Chlamydia trachomatis]
MIPVTLIGSSKEAKAEKIPRTVAAPAMSSFMVIIAFPGFKSSPPESNVTPLPMSTVLSLDLGLPW